MKKSKTVFDWLSCYFKTSEQSVWEKIVCDLEKLSDKVYQFDDFSFYSSLEEPNSWENHSHQELQITIPQVNAQAWITCLSDRTYTRQIKSGQSFLVAPHQTHNLDWHQEAELTLFYFHPNFFANFINEPLINRHLKIRQQFTLVDDPLICGIANIFNHLCSANLQIERLYVENLGNVLAAHLLKKYLELETEDVCKRLSSQKLALVLEYIEDNIDSKMSLSDLARICDIGKFYFCRLFKNSTNTTPYKYILQRRVERAKLLLRSSKLPITYIAYDCGFSSQSHLNKHFHVAVGMSPRKYRQQIDTRSN